MKKILYLLVISLLLCANAYAAPGDLVVNGNLTVGGTVSAPTLSVGAVGIRMYNITDTFDIVSDRSSRVISFTYYNNDTGPIVFSGKKARGSLSAPSHVIAGDGLISINGSGYGTQFSGTPGRIAINAAEDFSDIAHGTFITFGTANLGSVSQTEKMRIDSAGNVGIGTTAPGAKLHVNGGVKLGATVSVHANRPLCWTDAGTIGYCSDVINGTTGTCTCTAIN